MVSLHAVPRAVVSATLALLCCVVGTLDAQVRRPAPRAMPMVERNLMESLATGREFSTLLRLIQRAGLADTLRTGGPFTVFAPTNAAFARLPQRTMDGLIADRSRLRRVLMRHLLVGSAFRHHLIGLSSAIMVSGDTLSLRAERGTLRLDGGAMVTAWTLRASNGAIHTVDQVLLPHVGASRHYRTLAAP